jgi:RimJ/RimL family protein N-acetyltransferase
MTIGETRSRGASGGGLHLRGAVIGDADRLLRWRNEDEAVRTSRSGRRIGIAEHRAWLAGRLAGAAPRLWVAEWAGEAVGSVRVDLDGETGVVSVLVAPSRRGQGLGTTMLRALLEEVVVLDPQIATLVAEIRTDNEASRRAFAGVGFVPTGDVDGQFGRYTWTADRR